MKIDFSINLLAIGLLFMFAGCSSYRVSNAPANAPYLGSKTTFEGNVSLQLDNYDTAKKLVKDVLISNGFKLVLEDDQNKQMVGRRKVNEGFVTIAVYFYSASSSTKLRLVTQVPRDGTAYYRIHEQIFAELI